MISEAELESLLETLYLLRSPATATGLLTALKRAKSRVIQPQTLEEICQKFGINEEDDSENEVAIASYIVSGGITIIKSSQQLTLNH